MLNTIPSLRSEAKRGTQLMQVRTSYSTQSQVQTLARDKGAKHGCRNDGPRLRHMSWRLRRRTSCVLDLATSLKPRTLHPTYMDTFLRTGGPAHGIAHAGRFVPHAPSHGRALFVAVSRPLRLPTEAPAEFRLVRPSRAVRGGGERPSVCKDPFKPWMPPRTLGAGPLPRRVGPADRTRPG